mgnify:CR=1 FL=1
MAKSEEKTARMKTVLIPTVAGWRCCVQQSMFMVSVI